MKKSYEVEEKKPITPVMMGPGNENMIATKSKADIKSLGKIHSWTMYVRHDEILGRYLVFLKAHGHVFYNILHSP